MLFHVSITIRIPHDADRAEIQRLSAEEKEKAMELQRSGVWRHIWRVVGKWENISIFEVSSGEELHVILSSLPLYQYMDISVVALCQHPAAIDSAT